MRIIIVESYYHGTNEPAMNECPKRLELKKRASFFTFFKLFCYLFRTSLVSFLFLSLSWILFILPFLYSIAAAAEEATHIQPLVVILLLKKLGYIIVLFTPFAMFCDLI